MHTLVVAEKPSVARDIARVLGAKDRGEGCLIGGGYVVTWAIGQTKEKIAECARSHGFDRIRLCETFDECLALCTELAESGEAVLLSPACASWGMFPNYEVRGRMFKEYVNAL